MARYELLLGTVVPRPIALVTTVSAEGLINAAPYSLFNVVSHDPAVLMISVLAHPEGRFKDTALNIEATGEFVVNLVSEEIAGEMNQTCIDAPFGTDEMTLAGLDAKPSELVKPPRVASSPVSFECRLRQSISLGPNQVIIFGDIHIAHLEDELVVDAAKGLIETPKLKLFGAMHGARWYSRLSDLFSMDRPTWAARTDPE